MTDDQHLIENLRHERDNSTGHLRNLLTDAAHRIEQLQADREGYLPIEDPAALKDRPCLVRRGSNYAKAFFTGSMWAYWDGSAPVRIDFEPTHYRLLTPSRLRPRTADLDHCCSEEGRRYKAKHFLLLVRQNGVRDNDAMETLSLAIEEAGAEFAQAEIAELTGDAVPF